MMNQYNDRMGGRMSRPCDATPYRRPTVREGMMPLSPDRMGGCGCGLGRKQQTAGSCGARRGTSCAPMGKPEPVRTPLPTPCGSERNDRHACGCGGNSVSIQCKKLMEQIRAVDFALYETILYLDVYPHSCDALETYRKLKAQSEALHTEYEASCGPLTAFGNTGNTWEWMSQPFPWEYDAE